MTRPFVIVASMLAVLPNLPCNGAIGDMWGDYVIADRDISSFPTIYCGCGFQYQYWQEPLLYSAAKYNRLFNFPMLFHSIMCRLSDYCGADFDPYDQDKQTTEFPGCATPADLHAVAEAMIPTMADRNSAVSQLIPFFEAGGPTNIGCITLGPLMHAYGGSPLCVMPASNTVELAEESPIATQMYNANPLRAGVGRGGCFNVEGWLSCTNFSDRPQGFYVPTNHPMKHLCQFLSRTLSPLFVIDWEAMGIPTSNLIERVEMGQDEYGPTYFLTNSPNYMSPEPVPIVASNSTLRIEPWIRSWEALGGLSSIAWHTNTNVFEYEVDDGWVFRELTGEAIGRKKIELEGYIGYWMPKIDDTNFFPENGYGVTRVMGEVPDSQTVSSDKPSEIPYPSEILARNRPSKFFFAPSDYYVTSSLTNNHRSLTAPVSDYTEAVTNQVKIEAEYSWFYEKDDSPDNEHEVLFDQDEEMDWGYGTNTYRHQIIAYPGTYSYGWRFTGSSFTKMDIEIKSFSNNMQTVISPRFTRLPEWMGFPSIYDFAWPGAAMSVCRIKDGWNAHVTGVHLDQKTGKYVTDYGYGLDAGCYTYLRLDWKYFTWGPGSSYPYSSEMFDFMRFIFDRDMSQEPSPADAARLSRLAHPMPREIMLCIRDVQPPYPDNRIWSGPSPSYTITTHGKPRPYDAGGIPHTNNTWEAYYTVTNDWPDAEFKMWHDMIWVHDEDGRTNKIHELVWVTPPPEEDDTPTAPESVPGFMPQDDARAWARIVFIIDNGTELFYNVEWEPVKAWGICNEVTSAPDWPDPNEQH